MVSPAQHADCVIRVADTGMEVSYADGGMRAIPLPGTAELAPAVLEAIGEPAAGARVLLVVPDDWDSPRAEPIRSLLTSAGVDLQLWSHTPYLLEYAGPEGDTGASLLLRVGATVTEAASVHRTADGWMIDKSTKTGWGTDNLLVGDALARPGAERALRATVAPVLDQLPAAPVGPLWLAAETSSIPLLAELAAEIADRPVQVLSWTDATAEALREVSDIDAVNLVPSPARAADPVVPASRPPALGRGPIATFIAAGVLLFAFATGSALHPSGLFSLVSDRNNPDAGLDVPLAAPTSPHPAGDAAPVVEEGHPAEPAPAEQPTPSTDPGNSDSALQIGATRAPAASPSATTAPATTVPPTTGPTSAPPPPPAPVTTRPAPPPPVTTRPAPPPVTTTRPAPPPTTTTRPAPPPTTTQAPPATTTQPPPVTTRPPVTTEPAPAPTTTRPAAPADPEPAAPATTTS